MNVAFEKVVIFDRIYHLEFENAIALNTSFFNLKVCVYKCFPFFLNVGWLRTCQTLTMVRDLRHIVAITFI